MEKNRMHLLRVSGFALVLFVCLGLSVASEALNSIGLAGNSAYLFSVAFLIAILVAGAGRKMAVLVALGVAAINLPEAILIDWGLDKDLVLALVCAAILVPAAYNLLSD